MKAENKKPLHRSHLAKIASMNLLPSQQRTLENLLLEPIAYMPDDRFRKPTVMEPVMRQKVIVLPGKTLKGDQELTLFLQLNYARFRICQIRRKLLNRAKWDRPLVLELLDLNQHQLESRSKIVSGNMGLVLSMAKRVDYSGVEFTDLVSEGSMALLRATEKFDCSRGLKFSTYACRAIFKAFSRAAKQCYRYRGFFPSQWDSALEKDDHLDKERQETQEDWIDELQEIISQNIADLSNIEMLVVKLRFSLENPDRKPLTLKEVGAKLGLTKERIRQIQNKALGKLREVAQQRMVSV